MLLTNRQQLVGPRGPVWLSASRPEARGEDGCGRDRPGRFGCAALGGVLRAGAGARPVGPRRADPRLPAASRARPQPPAGRVPQLDPRGDLCPGRARPARGPSWRGGLRHLPRPGPAALLTRPDPGGRPAADEGRERRAGHVTRANGAEPRSRAGRQPPPSTSSRSWRWQRPPPSACAPGPRPRRRSTVPAPQPPATRPSPRCSTSPGGSVRPAAPLPDLVRRSAGDHQRLIAALRAKDPERARAAAARPRLPRRPRHGRPGGGCAPRSRPRRPSPPLARPGPYPGGGPTPRWASSSTGASTPYPAGHRSTTRSSSCSPMTRWRPSPTRRSTRSSGTPSPSGTRTAPPSPAAPPGDTTARSTATRGTATSASAFEQALARFDADSWVSQFASAGARYLVMVGQAPRRLPAVALGPPQPAHPGLGLPARRARRAQRRAARARR